MKRLSPHLGVDSLQIRNTGLRPNWQSFWAMETACSEMDRTPQRPKATDSLISCKSATSCGTRATGSGMRHIRLVTGSEWIGEWDRTGMTGMGTYRMPHGVIYEGTMKAGLFEGVGVLRYPNGSILEGLWYQGKLKYWQYDYADGLERDCQGWTYCAMPDRRFFSEHIVGLRPANAEQVTNDHPARDVPPGHYDVGMGFYNPKSHCVVDTITGEVLSIPTVAEEKWILERCRSSEPSDTVGYRPDLYENWQKKDEHHQNSSETSSESSGNKYANLDLFKGDSVSSKGFESRQLHFGGSEYSEVECDVHSSLWNAEKEILNTILQEGGRLSPENTAVTSPRKTSLHEKLENEQGNEHFKVESFEVLLKKLLKEMEFQQTVKTSEGSYDKTETLSNKSNVFRLTQIISAYAENRTSKKTSSLGSVLDQFRMAGKFLPSFSLTLPKNLSNRSYSGPSQMSSFECHTVEPCLGSKTLNESKSNESMIKSTIYERGEN